jgi:hypothetical protein
MSNHTLLHVMMRPLDIMALADPLPENVSHEPGNVALMLLEDMVNAGQYPLDAVRRRYKDVTDEKIEPMIVPSHEGIMKHVIAPLKEAKQCYVLGMPVACIAQAGLVGEMVALWRFRMLEPKLDDRPLDETLQKLLMGKEFDKLGQEDRVRVLRALDTLDETMIQAFGELRGIRRQYMHFMIDPKKNADCDARRAIQCACTLVTKTLGVTFREGCLVLPPKVMAYINDMLDHNSGTTSKDNNSD